MNWESFIQTAGFATLITALVTIATCFISYFQSIRKIKIEKFSEVYDCLQKFSDKKSEMTDRCNDLAAQITAKMPEYVSSTPLPGEVSKYREIYHAFVKFIIEYSKYLESLMSFYYYLYKDKPNIPATKAECWKILKLYASLTQIHYPDATEYRLEFMQIATLIQFIKINSGLAGRHEVYRFLVENAVLPGRWRCIITAIF